MYSKLMCLQVHPRALLELAWTAAGLLLSEKRKCAAANGWSVNITYTRNKKAMITKTFLMQAIYR